MNTWNCPLSEAFEVRFESLFVEGRGLAFPCDKAGRVDIDTLPPLARHNYLYARALVGRDFSAPRVQAATPATALCFSPVFS